MIGKFNDMVEFIMINLEHELKKELVGGKIILTVLPRCESAAKWAGSKTTVSVEDVGGMYYSKMMEYEPCEFEKEFGKSIASSSELYRMGVTFDVRQKVQIGSRSNSGI